MTSTDVEADSRQPPAAAAAGGWRAALLPWLLHDAPYIAMVLLALVGVAFRMPARYWVFLTPVFAVICVVAGWRHFASREARLELVYTQALGWFALMFAIYVLFNDVVQGVLNTSATSLAMMTLLALGTFFAGLHARVWRICVVGALMLVAVPCMGWLEQSALLLVGIVLALVAAGFAAWWWGARRAAAV
jgi:hypothetical protein